MSTVTSLPPPAHELHVIALSQTSSSPPRTTVLSQLNLRAPILAPHISSCFGPSSELPCATHHFRECDARVSSTSCHYEHGLNLLSNPSQIREKGPRQLSHPSYYSRHSLPSSSSSSGAASSSLVSSSSPSFCNCVRHAIPASLFLFPAHASTVSLILSP